MHSLLTTPVIDIANDQLSLEVLIVVRMRALPDRGAEVQLELEAALGRIRSGVPECTSILGFADPSVEGGFLLYERWRSLEEFRGYLLRPAMVEYLARLDQLLESRDISVWHEFDGPQ